MTGMVESAGDRTSEVREAMRVAIMTRIVNNDPLPSILETICKGLESEQAGIKCSVLLLDAERNELMLGAAPSLPEFYNRAVHGLRIGPAAGSCGTARL